MSISLILFGFFLAAPAIAFDAGWIDHFEGQSANYLIKRGQQKIPVRLFTVLQVGDEISVTKKQHTITINLRGGTHTVQVTLENSPFKINDANQVPERLNNLWTWTRQYLSEWQKFTQSVTSYDNQTVSEQPKKPIVPLLANVKSMAALVAGKRALYLQWAGGKSPYQILVLKRHNRLLSNTSIMPQIKTEIIDFQANKSYRIMVIDADGQSSIAGFRVVTAIQQPIFPEIFKEANLPENFRQTLQATWLAMQENGKWVFEAYQQIAQLTDYYPAQLLKQALAFQQKMQIQTIRGIRG
ncbi:secreted protein [Beggiatoa sp. PS]|nr:secreted protein [Beggiatoa sp. PS]